MLALFMEIRVSNLIMIKRLFFLFLSVILMSIKFSAQQYEIQVLNDIYESPNDYTSLCKNGDMLSEVVIDFGFEFPYYEDKYNDLLATIQSTYFVDTDNDINEDPLYEVELYSNLWHNKGWFFNECQSDWRYFYTSKALI